MSASDAVSDEASPILSALTGSHSTPAQEQEMTLDIMHALLQTLSVTMQPGCVGAAVGGGPHETCPTGLVLHVKPAVVHEPCGLLSEQAGATGCPG